MNKMHFGNYIQTLWLFVGAGLQIWIGGTKGFVVMFIGILILFF